MSFRHPGRHGGWFNGASPVPVRTGISPHIQTAFFCLIALLREYNKVIEDYFHPLLRASRGRGESPMDARLVIPLSGEGVPAVPGFFLPPAHPRLRVKGKGEET
jgi:hypothetical protein